ncbi:DUF2012 domain-containing protein [Flavobacteriaceae bacterium R38]|nr:DUF2012 domain-containing protein [Flavobacteriaceae bacterium R38]
MFKKLLLFLFLMTPVFMFSQLKSTLTGIVKDIQTNEVLAGVVVRIEELSIQKKTGIDGSFIFQNLSKGNYTLTLEVPDYNTNKLAIIISDGSEVKLKTIFLERTIAQEQSDNLIALTENDLNDDTDINFSSGLLQATRDVFLTRAAFDFSQVFFNVRGYDSREGTVMINGVSMNKLFNGRPQWNNWGGLNDVTRNQTYTNGLALSRNDFGGILGTTNINTRASVYRKGLRISTSASNRTYSGRLMATYNSGLQKNGFAYSISASGRRSEEGYIDGTFYDAYSVFTSLEYQFAKKQSVNLTTILASNRRGQSTAITDEVFDLAGSRYNPFWGLQDGKIRNSRSRKIREPIFIFNHFFEGKKLKLNSSITYQFGQFGRTRLSFFDAPNPDPSNFRNLPSFYINTNGNPSFENALLAREGFIENPQLNWDALYQANSSSDLNGESVYILQEDRTDDIQLTLNTIANLDISDKVQIDAKLTYRKLTSDNYALINDLLGGSFYNDIDTFSNTRNDIEGELVKRKEDRFRYNYLLNSNVFRFFSQVKLNYKRWNAFFTGSFSQTTYQREGQFLNERFIDNSLGESEPVEFSNYSVKGGFEYKITSRHILTANGLYLTRPPTLQNAFINPRENNNIINNISEEKILSTDVNYWLKLPKINARLSAFYTRIEDITDVSFFFVEGGFGSDFVQEVATGINKLHFGGELGLEYQVSPSVKLIFAASAGKYTYDNDPNISIYFDTSEDDVINEEGVLDLGASTLKGLRLNTGPQQAYAIGLEYRDPKYWWLSITANQLSENYIGISKINRTASFRINPETNAPFPEATDAAVTRILEQKPLETIYLMNIVGGKSWLINGKYVSLFASVNNVFNLTFKSSGFEQSRAGNFGRLKRDQLRGAPSFGPRHWYGFGRTFFINLAINF